MAESQNGWPVVAKSQCDQGPFQGRVFPNGILKGDVATIAEWQLTRYKALVEPLMDPGCWGWFVKKIKGSDDYSNHSSGTAWDINAPKYPLGAEPGDVMSAKKIAACRQIVREFEGVLRWGGDYSGRKDVMHWEINKGKTAVAALAKKIKDGLMPGQEDLVTPADLAKIQTMITNTVNSAVSAAVSALKADAAARTDDHLKVSGWSSGYPGRTEAQHMDDVQVLRNALVVPDKTGAQIPADAPLGRIIRAADKILAEKES